PTSSTWASAGSSAGNLHPTWKIAPWNRRSRYVGGDHRARASLHLRGRPSYGARNQSDGSGLNPGGGQSLARWGHSSPNPTRSYRRARWYRCANAPEEAPHDSNQGHSVSHLVRTSTSPESAAHVSGLRRTRE